jgi:hypothetical protein
MLLGFSYHGIRFAVGAISKAPGRLDAIVALVVISGFLGAAVIVVPFAFASNSEVSSGEFMLRIIFAVSSIAGLAGKHFSGQYVLTEIPIYGLCASAFYLSAASFPFTWIWLADSLGAQFGIRWAY